MLTASSPAPASHPGLGRGDFLRPTATHLRRRPPLRVVAAAALAALMLHGIVLSGLPAGLGRDVEAQPTLGTVRVRTLALPAPTPAPAVVGVTSAPPPPPVAAAALTAPANRAPAKGSPAHAPAPPTRPADEVAASTPAPMVVPVADAASAVEAATSTPAPANVAAIDPPPSELPPTAPAASSPLPGAAPPAAAVADSGEEIPVYATAFAPSQALSYHLSRGMLSGTGSLSWRHDGPGTAGARYELQLEAKVAGMSLLTQRSEGGFDTAGLAPKRFTDQRLRGSARAANFQRGLGVISFSGPSVEYPLIPGVQDRLSWMLQLPAIVAASPQRAAAGERITLYVIGARGDAAVWVFRFVAAEPVRTDGGEVPALKFIREPRKPNDTQAEVWLDPAQHYLPVRARIGNPPDGDVLDLIRVPP